MREEAQSRESQREAIAEEPVKAAATSDTVLVGKDYFRNPDVNAGFYSKKREGVADVDPKVRTK